MANVLMSFLLPESLLNELRAVAEKNCLSVSAQLRTLIVNYLKEQKTVQFLALFNSFYPLSSKNLHFDISLFLKLIAFRISNYYSC